MKKATLGLSILLCAGALTHALGGYYYVSESDRWQSYHGMSGLPLNSSQPITVKITGPTDSQGYPTGEIYYNDVFACGTNYYRYFPSFVSRVVGQGWSPDFGDEFIPTSLIQDDNVGYDYGWVIGDAASSTLMEWVDGGDISFYGGCGSHKLGVSIKDVLTIAKIGRARLTIDRLLYSSTNLANMHDGSPMWVGDVWDNWDRYRMSRAYYYLYLTMSTRYYGYTCENNTCTKNATNTYNLTKGGKLDFSFEEFAADYATVRVYDQRRHYTLSNGKYVAGNWATTTVGSCYGTNESGTRTKCNSLRDVAITWDNSVHKGDSLVEFRRMWVTTIATGQSNSGAHAMEVYDTAYSDIIKLVPKYRVVVSTSERGKLSDPINNYYVAGTKLRVWEEPYIGNEFKCWSTDEAGTNCVSTSNPLSLTVRDDTTLYAAYSEHPLTLTMEIYTPWTNKWHQGYDHVFGRSTIGFSFDLSGSNRKAYFACEYRNGSDSWKRLGNVYEVSAIRVAAGTAGFLDIDENSVVSCILTDTLGSMQMKWADSTDFRTVVSYNQDMSDAVYSNVEYVQWRYPVVFRDTGNEVIYDEPAIWGESVVLPNRNGLKIPENTSDIIYDFRWTALGSSMSSECGKIKSTATTTTITGLDSLTCYPQVFHGYRVKFVDAADGTVLKDTIVKEHILNNGYVVSPYLPVPEEMEHKGLVFKGWDHEVDEGNNITDITEPMTVTTLYDTPKDLQFGFTITDFDYGSSSENIKVTGPNDCFEFSKKIVKRTDEDVEVESVNNWDVHYLALDVSVECADDSVGNIWKYLVGAQFKDDKPFYAKVNGVEDEFGYKYNDAHKLIASLWYFIIPVTFVDYDQKVLKQEFVPFESSATPPENPERDGYVFKGWDSDYENVTNSMTIHANYEKVESSSSAEGKSSSSQGKTGIVPVGQVPQFSLAAVGRNIQVSGAIVGSAYAVFDMQGRVLRQGRVESANFNMTFANAGTYLVRIAGQSATVRLR